MREKIIKEATRSKYWNFLRINILVLDIIYRKGSFAIVVCDGRARMTELPEHGETKIVTLQRKVKRVKFDEGEEF